MQRVIYQELKSERGFWLALGVIALVTLTGLGAALFMEHSGHIVTGMDNRIVWGMPHVFAIFLIVAASGALNVASVGSVFGREAYKPLARFSTLLAMALLIGGLAVLVLDLGRPERLVVAMTNYNFKSIFTWNIFLYSGFVAVAAAYLFVMMARGTTWLTKPVGLVAFVWRLLLTTGTGSIFGWLVAREAYNAAVMAPLFIALSLALGTAAFILATAGLFALEGRAFQSGLVIRLGRLMGVFVAAVLYFTAVQHLTNLYAAQRLAVASFLLWSGGIFPLLFWIVQVALGALIPLALVFLASSRTAALLAAGLVLLGGFAQLYVIIIGGQAFPLMLFPGYEVSKTFLDGSVASYSPSLPEVLLGLGGVAISLGIVLAGARIFRILPDRIIDEPSDRPKSAPAAVARAMPNVPAAAAR
ncbi:MAG: NrfD/PsrC family molybdoenzyme membrane anchor subunit [Hyphomicrobiaceae bacterium]